MLWELFISTSNKCFILFVVKFTCIHFKFKYFCLNIYIGYYYEQLFEDQIELKVLCS